MGIVGRYILIELIKVFVVTLTLLTLMMMFIGVGQQAVKEGLGLAPILRLVPYLLPNALRFAVPGTILLTACCVYGRISSDNEIVAVKALGISPMVMIWPALILATVASLFSVWLNDVAVSWGHEGARRVVIESIEEIAYGRLRTHKSFSSSRFSILVKDVEGDRLIRPEILVPAGEHSPQLSISAVEATLKSDTDNNRLIISLIDSRIEAEGNEAGSFDHPGVMQHVISLDDSEEYRIAISPSYLSLSEIDTNMVMHQKIAKERRESFAAMTTFALMTGDLHKMHSDEWDHWVSKVDWSRLRINRVRTEPHRRWTNGFSCLFFVMLGIPLAIRQRNSDWVSTFFMAFMPVLLIFYPLLAYGVDRAKEGALPPIAVWGGNLVLFLIGLILLRRVMRY